MSRSKKLFMVFAIVFVLLLAWASYDIASRTTFPGSKPQSKGRTEDSTQKPPVNVEDTLNKSEDSTLIRP